MSVVPSPSRFPIWQLIEQPIRSHISYCTWFTRLKMGNVLAASPPNPSSSSNVTAMPPPPPLTAAPPIEEKPKSLPKRSTENNPGTYEELHKACKDVFPQPFEGCKLAINKGLSNHFQVSHTLQLSGMGPGAYHFGATYVGNKQTGPNEAFPVLLGDIDLNGSLNAQIIHQFTERIRGKAIIQTKKSVWLLVQSDAEYRGNDFTATITTANIDIVNGSGIVVAHYLQRMAPRIDIGGELLYHYGAQEAAMMSLAGRYTADRWIASATVGQTGWHLSYWHKGNENVKVGVEYEFNTRGGDSSVSAGYQIEVPKSNISFRGMVDTNWTVAGVMEKRLPPLPFTFVLSGMLNHAKNQARFGFGLNIG